MAFKGNGLTENSGILAHQDNTKLGNSAFID